MNPLHLLWIIPVSMTAGAFCTALITGYVRDMAYHYDDWVEE